MNDRADDTEPHLLVVDDDARLRELLRRYLSDNGFRVTAAADAVEARASLASFAFDLIVLDVMMPVLDGYDVLRVLKANPEMQSIPVVLLTAKAMDDEVWDGWKSGADYYMTKPFVPDELARFVRHVLGPGGEL